MTAVRVTTPIILSEDNEAEVNKKMEGRNSAKKEPDQPVSHRKLPLMKEDTLISTTLLQRGCMLSKKWNSISRKLSPSMVMGYNQKSGKQFDRLTNTRKIKQHTAKLPKDKKKTGKGK